VSPELQKLIQLQDIDVRAFDLTDRLEAIPAERQQIEEQFRQEAADYLGLEEQLSEARAERRRVEADLAQYEGQHEKFKSDLMRVRNQKEYGTILREIDATKKSIGALETEALQFMEKIEELDKRIADQAPDFARHRAEVDATLGGLDAEVERINSELASLQASRDEIARDVSPNMLRVYDRIAKTRKGRAMSQVRGEIGGKGRCSACNMSLRPQIFSDIRRGDDLIVCDNCNRILFYRPEQEAPVEANAS
jgi:predicted  nucleic acid-binding Zn-ribbon protein